LRTRSSLYDVKKKVSSEIPWNYTKFLVSGDGKKVRYFHPTEDPIKLKPYIDKFLAG
jgi:glutathione peroxidase